MKVLAFVETAAGKAVHAVEVIGHGAVCVERLLVDGQKLEPAAKTAILNIVRDGEAIATASVAAGSGEGMNFAADALVIEAVKQFVSDFVAALPVLKNAASVLGADLKTV